jgi:hypothetical protein
MRARLPIYVASGVSLGVIVAYLIAGGASYKPLQAADPCESRPLAVLAERGLFEGIALSALDGAACRLQVTREELTAALADPIALEEFSAEHQLDDTEVEAAVRAGLLRAIADAEVEGMLSPGTAAIARAAAENAPVAAVIDVFEALPGDPSLADLIAAVAELGLNFEELRNLGGAGLDELDRLEDRLEELLPEGFETPEGLQLPGLDDVLE